MFHAVGPGHGKAVVTSYVLATGETLRRGIAISFVAALLQAVSAIAIVSVFTIALGATAMTMGRATDAIEIASYALITLLGIVLLWRKALRPLLRNGVRPLAHGDQGHDHHHGHGDHDHHTGHGHGHDGHHHVHDAHCGHAHLPEPADLAGPFHWRKAAAAAVAVGIRPCSGALIVLVFALSQGLFAAGVAATLAMSVGTGMTVSALAAAAVLARGLAERVSDGGRGMAAMLRVVEIAAALVVFLFGTLMLTGALAAGGYV